MRTQKLRFFLFVERRAPQTLTKVFCFHLKMSLKWTLEESMDPIYHTSFGGYNNCAALEFCDITKLNNWTTHQNMSLTSNAKKLQIQIWITSRRLYVLLCIKLGATHHIAQPIFFTPVYNLLLYEFP